MKYIKSVLLTFVIIGLINTIIVKAAHDEGIAEDEELEFPICPCPRLYLPVCGSNNVTYGNECEFLCAASSDLGKKIGLMMLKMGSCLEFKDKNAL